MDNNNPSFQFKTNINCEGCVAAVKPALDKIAGTNHWEVNTSNKDKILTVDSNGVTAKQIIATVQKAGYKIESISQ